MFNIDKIRKEITYLSDDNMVGLWNEYCEANNYYDDYIEYNDIDELLYGCKPSEVLNRIDKKNYNECDRYCTYDACGELYSFDCADGYGSPFDLDSLAQWIYDNEDACGWLDEYDISYHFDAVSFVDEFFNDDDVDTFIEINDIDVDENVDKYDACKDYLADLDDDTEEIVLSLSGLGWTDDIEERILEFFN